MKLTSWIWAICLIVAPLMYVVIISFLTRGDYGGVMWEWTFINYKKIFDPSIFPILASSFGRSLLMATLTTALCALIGFPLALFLVFRAGRFRQFLFFLLIIPFWTNFLIRTYAWYALLADNGWLNSTFEVFGFGPQSVRILFTPAAILIGMLYNYLPYMAMSLYISVEKIDPHLLEAAADLGAGPLKRFFKITLPLCGPGLLAGSIMVFIPSLGEFVIPDILGGGTNLYVGNLLAQQFLVTRNWPFGAALSLVLMLMVFILMKLGKKAQYEVA